MKKFFILFIMSLLTNFGTNFAGHSEVIEVKMYEQKVLQRSREYDSQIIFTDGLAGCNASALIINYINGDCTVIMNHFPALAKREHITVIENFMKALSQKDIHEKKLFLVLSSVDEELIDNLSRITGCAPFLKIYDSAKEIKKFEVSITKTSIKPTITDSELKTAVSDVELEEMAKLIAKVLIAERGPAATQNIDDETLEAFGKKLFSRFKT